MSNLSKKSTKFLCINESPEKNLVGNPRIIRDVAVNIHSNIQQWNTIHLNGVYLLKNITTLKVDKTYSEKLKQPFEELGKICDEADKIVNNLCLQTNHIKAVSGLHKTEDSLFRTWPIKKFVSISEKIYQVYQNEAWVKRIILENVAHDHRHSWKMLHLAAWVYQTQIPKNIAMNFESMLIETKLR